MLPSSSSSSSKSSLLLNSGYVQELSLDNNIHIRTFLSGGVPQGLSMGSVLFKSPITEEPAA